MIHLACRTSEANFSVLKLWSRHCNPLATTAILRKIRPGMEPPYACRAMGGPSSAVAGTQIVPPGSRLHAQDLLLPHGPPTPLKVCSPPCFRRTAVSAAHLL